MQSNQETPIITEQTYPASPDRVWKAITEPEQMKQWFFSPIAAFKADVGFETTFIVNSEGRDYLHAWKVTEVIPRRKLVYDWKYGGISGASFVAWELSQTADGTKLRVTHTGHETFPRDNEAFSRQAGEAGWRYFIQETLKTYLEGRRENAAH